MKTLYILILLVVSSLCAEAKIRKSLRYNISITVGKTKLNFTTNPFLDQDGLPKFSAIKASDLSPAIHHLVEKLEQDFSLFELKISKEDYIPTYDDVLPELERIVFPLKYAWGVADHLVKVKTTNELLGAFEENQPIVVTIMNKMSQSRPLFNAISTIDEQWKKDRTNSTNDFYMSQKVRAIANKVISMKLGGVGLDGEAKDRFNKIELRLRELSLSFGNNILHSTNAFHLDIENAEDVANVPSSAKALWANNYAIAVCTLENKVQVVADPENGPWRITLDGPSYNEAMSHIPNRNIREKVYRASHTRASEFTENDGGSDKNNVPYIYEMLELKKERGRMLGFNSTAEMSIATKMASSVENVIDFLEMILEKALPAALREFEEITLFARSNGGDKYSQENLEGLMPWDISFWSQRLKESKFNLKEEEPFPSVLDGMFGIVERIFNIEVKEADGEVDVWDKDVSFFNVFDKDSQKHIGSFYLDPYSRPAEKRGGAWMKVCIGKSEAVKRDIPVAYLNCNGSPPIGDTPSLMTFSEVKTLFHEFGHGLQHMLTTATVGDVAGLNGIARDAREISSQFMENWCYNKNTLRGLTDQPLPESIRMGVKLIELKTYGAGMMICRQILLSLLDMELYYDFDPEFAKNGGPTVFDVHRSKAKQCTPYTTLIENDRFLCTFHHIFGGAYSAGYYSYMWAEVMAADAFGAFEEVGLNNAEKVKEVGLKFRDTILSLGGGIDPMLVFKEFRGREPSPDALLRQYGLV